MVEINERWSDILLVEQPEPTISYRTGWIVYEESLIKGRFVGRGWNGSAAINFYDGRIDPGQHPTPQAFWLEIDGQLLASDWEWLGVEKHTPDSDRPAEIHAVISLKHAVRPVTVKVHTKLDGTAILTRWLEVTNTSDSPAALGAAYSWSGVIQRVPRWRSHLGKTGRSLYSIGYFLNSHWGNEGDFHWHDLPPAGYRIDGRFRRDRHRHPFFVLRNNATGEHFIGQLAWTGGYSLEFDLDAHPGTDDQSASLFFRTGPDAPAPQRIIAPGETVTIPEMHLGMTFGDFDTAVQAMHDHLRESVFMPQPRGRGGWVESAIGPEIEMTHEQVLHSLNVAGETGAEVFFIDASWYAPPGASWWSTVGDWEVYPERYPNGLAEFRDLAHSKGMLFGVWMDAERFGPESRLYKEHPEWEAVSYTGEKPFGGLLDLTKPEVAQHVEDAIVRVIGDNKLDFFRLDWNTANASTGWKSERDGYTENGYWRYYEALYAIYDRLRDRFPDVIFENCAGGGARSDIGMIRRFSHTWITDWQIAPRAFSITNGMTMALPPESVDRVFGGQSGHITAEYDFQSRLLLFARPTYGFSRPIGSEPNPLALERLKHWIGLYKNFVRPYLHGGRIYHHTPEVTGADPQGWGVLEMASRDRTRGMCGLFQLSAPTEPEYLLRLRGLDVGRRYRVTWDNTGQTSEVDGFLLIKHGITVRLEGALTSELLLFEAV